MGFKNVIEFFDGSEALKEIAKGATPVDLIITDIYMRKVSGFQVLKKVRSQVIAHDIPIIIVTGEGSKEDIVKASDLGADDYVIKPFQLSDIERKVTSVLTKFHSPSPLLKLIRQGERLMTEEHFADALKLFEAAERLDSASARAQNCKALALERMGHVSDALRVLQESIANNSTYYKSFAAIADIHMKNGQKNLAISAMKSELELNPKQARRQILLANILMEEGDFLGALEHFREAAKENPKSKEALLGLGRAADANSDQEKAVYYYKRARRQHPDLTMALELIVESFERSGKLKYAVPVILEDIQLTPGKPDGRIILAGIYSKLAEVDKAFKVLDEGLVRDGSSVPLLTAKVRVLLSTNDAINAVLLCKKIIGIEPNSVNYTLLGLAQVQEGNFKDASVSFITALRDASDKAKVCSALADVCKRLGNVTQGLFLLRLALATAGGSTKENLQKEYDTLKNLRKERRSGAAKPSVGKKAS